MKKTKQVPEIDTGLLIGVGLILAGIAAIAINAFLKTPEGKKYDAMSIEELDFEMVEAVKKEDYEMAATIRDLITLKKRTA